jgi:hypothetical protein
VHDGQDLLGNVLGLDEGDEAKPPLALRADNFKLEGSAEQLCARDIVVVVGAVIYLLGR